MIHKKLSPTAIQLVEVLSDMECHSGLKIGHLLGVSRTAIWKAVASLQEYGLRIESIKNRGYRLIEPVVLLSESAIVSCMEKTILESFDMQIYASVPSTNDFPGVDNPDARFKVCLAEEQTQGRGRFGRVWASPFAENIYCSVQLQFDCDVSQVGGFSLVVATSLLQAFEKNHISGLSVKWPNDILFEGKKVAGVLIEVNAESNGATFLNIGMGINVNQICGDAEVLNQPWTSLRQIIHQPLNRNILVASILNQVHHDALMFERKGLSAFLSVWQKFDYLSHKLVSVLSAGRQYTGIARGVDQLGHLVLDIKGDMRSFSSGDTSVKK